jgi:hypothetical protein
LLSNYYHFPAVKESFISADTDGIMPFNKIKIKTKTKACGENG